MILMYHTGVDEKWPSLEELVELRKGITHCESVMRKVGHDKNNLISVSHARENRDDVVMTPAEKQKYIKCLI